MAGIDDRFSNIAAPRQKEVRLWDGYYLFPLFLFSSTKFIICLNKTIFCRAAAENC
jgi:hypothetical protein